jgi:hypothetical protein
MTSFTSCQSSICSCDMNGFATHWTYNTPTNLVTMATFTCASKNNEAQFITSESLKPTIPSKCLVFRVNKSCYSEKRQILFLTNYLYLGLRYARIVLAVSHIHVRYVSISNVYLHYIYIANTNNTETLTKLSGKKFELEVKPSFCVTLIDLNGRTMGTGHD